MNEVELIYLFTGNINVYLTDDSNVAESQLLIYITRFTQHSQYTTDSDSSGVATLLSRFDLLWIIQDKNDREIGFKLVRHTAFVHQTGCQLEIENFTVKTLK
ncbi:unnamed protein product [Adineta steineri]|uniref:Uncharacterized protein n=1 Tax=Adineta steineri TaxID=433720 RepID=A0A818U417_9BILA|nr:unnamed protein product [Adineta steineri]